MDRALFLPAFMAVGILVSGAIIVADWLSGMLPAREARRRQAVTRNALAVVCRVAASIGAEVRPLPLARRVSRARRFYVVAAAVFAAVGAITVWLGVDVYQDPLSWLGGNPWALAMGFGIGGTLLVIGVAAVIPAVASLRSGQVVRSLVERTWLGRPAMPPGDPTQLVQSERTPS